MVNDPLTTYLRTYRRKTGLSQDDVAYLLSTSDNRSESRGTGSPAGTTVSRHECGDQRPKLEFALAYEIILGVPLKDIYAGVYMQLHANIRVRAADLLEGLSEAAPNSRNQQKVEAIKRIMAALA